MGSRYHKLQSVYLHIPEQWKLLLKLFEITQIFKICVHGLKKKLFWNDFSAV